MIVTRRTYQANAIGIFAGVLWVAFSLAAQAGSTNTFAQAGVYTNTVPSGANVLFVKLWGAGGGSYGSGGNSQGGGGAFVQKFLPVTNGQQFVLVVGQGGSGTFNQTLGGVQNGISSGGSPHAYYAYGQGGQASSLFQWQDGTFLTRAVAGAGGGAYIYSDGGAGGNPGSPAARGDFNNPGRGGHDGIGGAGGGYGNAGGNYSATATTSGITALNQAGGNGAEGYYEISGGGGGGYGGGGGGGYCGGGGGGGSYGDWIVGGYGYLAGNNTDPYYLPGAGEGGMAPSSVNGRDGLAVIIFQTRNAPVATTLPATAVWTNTATLHGSVLPSFDNTTAWFRYGTTTNYDQTTAAVSIGEANPSPVPVAQQVELLPATTYHFQLVATNGYGTNYGADLTFTTAPLAPSVTTLEATGISRTDATLNGSVNPNHADTTAWFEYGPTPAYGSSTAPVFVAGTNALPVTLTHLLSNLPVFTTYHFRLVASNVTGLSYGADQTFLTVMATAGATNLYTAAGIYTNTVPSGANTMIVKLWGAGGASGPYTSQGGGGAFVSTVLPVTNGQQFLTVVGERGSQRYGVVLSGHGNGISHGGLRFWSNPGGEGGQASSLFLCNAGAFVMKAVAGGGGGAGIFANGGAGGNPGANGLVYNGYQGTAGSGGHDGLAGGGDGPGSDYAPNATTTGITALNLAGGNGGDANYCGGGGGGGYGGGGGGSGGTSGNSGAGGGGGGGSYGSLIIGGNGYLPGNTSDPDYIGSAGRGGPSRQMDGNDGLVVVIFKNVQAPEVTTLAASRVKLYSAILNGSVYPSAADSTAWFRYGTTTNYASATAPVFIGASNGIPVLIANLVSNLAPNTVYHFQMVATNSVGTTYGQDLVFTTAPSAPFLTTINPAGTTQTNTTLQGTVDPDGADTMAWFRYGTTTNYGSITAAVPIAGTSLDSMAISSLMSGLRPGALYHFQLVATNSFGASFGEDATFTTLLPPAPAVVNAAATVVTRMGAVLNGTIHPNGGDSYAWFCYGTTTSYGNSTTPVLVDWTQTSAMAISALASNLVPGTLYHFQLVATNIGGITYGSDLTFTTVPPAAPEVVTLAATALTRSNAMMNGTVTANGADTTAWFRYGATTNYGTDTDPVLIPWASTVSIPVPAMVGDLLAGTSYHFQLVASNNAGTLYGSDLQFTTASPLPPLATTLPASNLSCTEILLAGTIDPGGGLATTWFQYGPTTNYGSTSALLPAAGNNVVPVTMAVSNLVGLTTYHFRLVATNAAGTNYGGDLTFTTPMPPGGVTNIYTTAGIYTNSVPFPANLITVKLWGAGGGGSGGFYGNGGGGAYVESSLPVTNGQQFVLVVGQGGAVSSASMGGVANSVSSGGAPGYLGDYNNRGQGGQASSLFYLTNGVFIMKAVAGAGGGSGLGFSANKSDGGAGGNPGANGLPSGDSNFGAGGDNGLGGTGGGAAGSNYASNATTTGITALNLAGGNGGNATKWSGGGGGGFGGGAGGGNGSSGNGAGGGGGGSYGDLVIPGSGYRPGNTNDPSYLAGAGQGGLRTVGGSGMAAIIYRLVLPEVATLAASQVTRSSAVLNGTVNPNHISGTAWFEYGATTNYGRLTEAVHFDGATTNGLSLPVTELSPVTSYHYRLVAVNNAGTNYGADGVLTTLANLPVALLLPVTNVTVTSALFSGTVNPEGEATAWFTYGTLDDPVGRTTTPWIIPATPEGFIILSHAVSDLSAGTTYWLRLTVTNNAGGSTNELSFSSARPPAFCGNVSRIDSAFAFQFTGTPGSSYTVWQSSDLINWTPRTNTVSTTPTNTIHLDGNQPRLFFKLSSP